MPIAITDEYINEKVYSRNDFARLLYLFYLQIKHGDEKHQKWLKDETFKFIHDETTKEAVEKHREKMKQWRERETK